jgi:hypothetical protein
MKIVFIVPASGLRRIPMYRWGGKIYGQSNSITGPLILGGILRRAGHQVEAYEELNAGVNYKKLLKDTDVFCISCMTSNAPRGYQLADMIHEKSGARVIMGGMHPTWMPEEAAQHADKMFYQFSDAKVIGKLFGREYGRRRWGLALMAKLGVWGAHVASRIGKGSVYYDLRHFEVENNPAPQEKQEEFGKQEGSRQTRSA